MPGQKGSSGETDVVRVEDIEGLLGRLDGVVSARLTVNDWGGIQEIHILGTGNRGPKQIVRDVESALAARWGITIDHKKVSVAQLAEADLPSWLFRLKLVRLQIAADVVQGQVEITVTLANPEDEEETFTGKGSGFTGGPQALWIAGQAATEAINRAVDPGHKFVFNGAQTVAIGGQTLVVCLYSLVPPRGDEESLAGSAVVKNDPVEAMVRAALAATNRHLARHFHRRRRPGRGVDLARKPAGRPPEPAEEEAQDSPEV